MYWTELKVGNIVAIDNNGKNWETCWFRGWDSGVDGTAMKELFYYRDKWWYGFERGWKLRVEIEDMEPIFVKVVAEVMWAKHHCHVSWSHVSKVITVTAATDIIMEHCNKGTEGVSKYICKFTIIPKSKLDKVPWKKDQISVKNGGHWIIWKTG